MALPTPTIYTYRIRQVARSVTPLLAYYIPEFSTDSGTSWKILFPEPYQSILESQQAIAFVVENEASFSSNYLAGKSLVPTISTIAYP